MWLALYLQRPWVKAGNAPLQRHREALDLTLGKEGHPEAGLGGSGDGGQQEHGAAQIVLSHQKHATSRSWRYFISRCYVPLRLKRLKHES